MKELDFLIYEMERKLRNMDPDEVPISTAGKTIDHMELFRETVTGEYLVCSLNLCFSDGTLLMIHARTEVGEHGVTPFLAYSMQEWSIQSQGVLQNTGLENA